MKSFNKLLLVNICIKRIVNQEQHFYQAVITRRNKSYNADVRSVINGEVVKIPAFGVNANMAFNQIEFNFDCPSMGKVKIDANLNHHHRQETKFSTSHSEGEYCMSIGVMWSDDV